MPLQEQVQKPVAAAPETAVPDLQAALALIKADPGPGPELSVVIPTRNERDNIATLHAALNTALAGERWEVIFVDDDSSDGTADAVSALATADRRVRLISRIGRRGLSSACIEGIQASTAPYVAVMDGDLQHDESLLPRMLKSLREEPFDLVIGSSYVAGGGVGQWDESRVGASRLATTLGQRLLRVGVADPMSGFFMMRRDAFADTVRRLSATGFKILIDILASASRPLRVKEMPFTFRSRHAGESKLDALVAWEYLVLLLDKLVGRYVPVRFILFTAVGAVGLAVHLAVLWLSLSQAQLSFAASQLTATLVAMVGNFMLNNWLTYRDQRLHGFRLALGLVSFLIICGFGAIANVGVASLLYGEQHATWWLAGIAGAAMSSVWNYAVSSVITWRRVR
jgi:dolichol-phosphate mannosyltransferase